jgi:hypothetical protein
MSFIVDYNITKFQINQDSVGFKLFTLELKIIDALQQIFFSPKFVIISYTIMHESEITECYFFLHLLHQNSCLVFVKKKHSPLFSS